jgi:hypothetical protein
VKSERIETERIRRLESEKVRKNKGKRRNVKLCLLEV